MRSRHVLVSLLASLESTLGEIYVRINTRNFYRVLRVRNVEGRRLLWLYQMLCRHISIERMHTIKSEDESLEKESDVSNLSMRASLLFSRHVVHIDPWLQ